MANTMDTYWFGGSPLVLDGASSTGDMNTYWLGGAPYVISGMDTPATPVVNNYPVYLLII